MDLSVISVVLSVISVVLGVVAIVIAVAIFNRQSAVSEKEARRHQELLRQTNETAYRAVRLATAERMMTTAQNLRNLLPSYNSAHEVARDLIEASASKTPRVLWVDDDPKAVELETELLEAAGIRTTHVRSTEEAQKVLSSASIHELVISDMERGSNSRAGYALLNWVNRQSSPTPLVFYTSSGDPAHHNEAQKKGAVGSTNDPVVLFKYVAKSLRCEPEVSNSSVASSGGGQEPGASTEG